MLDKIDEAIVSRFERWIAHPLIDFGLPLVWQWRIATVCFIAVCMWLTYKDHDWVAAFIALTRSISLMSSPLLGFVGTADTLSDTSHPNPMRVTCRWSRVIIDSMFIIFNTIDVFLGKGIFVFGIALWFIFQIEGCNPREPGKRVKQEQLCMDN